MPPSMCHITGTAYKPGSTDATPDVIPGARLTVSEMYAPGSLLQHSGQDFFADENGLFDFYLVRGSTARLKGNFRGFTGLGSVRSIPDSASATLESLVPAVVSTPTASNFNFRALLDTPDSYSGQAGKVPVVNGAENALEFVDVATQAEMAAAVESASSEEASARDAAIATASASDRARTNHTGTQAISTVSGLQTALDQTERILALGVVLNLNTDTKQTLYTVPTGKSAVITKLVIRNPSTSLAGISTTVVTFGFDAGAFDWTAAWQSPVFMTSTGYFLVINQDSGAEFQQFSDVGTAGEVFGAVCDVAAGSAKTVRVDIIGYTF